MLPRDKRIFQGSKKPGGEPPGFMMSLVWARAMFLRNRGSGHRRAIADIADGDDGLTGALEDRASECIGRGVGGKRCAVHENVGREGVQLALIVQSIESAGSGLINRIEPVTAFCGGNLRLHGGDLRVLRVNLRVLQCRHTDADQDTDDYDDHEEFDQSKTLRVEVFDLHVVDRECALHSRSRAISPLGASLWVISPCEWVATVT